MSKTYIDGRLEDETWTRLEDDAVLPDEGRVLVSPTRWRDVRSQLLSRGQAGVFVSPTTDDEAVLADITDAPLVVIAFAKYSDGRGYSLARLLRGQHAYAGDLRAAGDVLLDQVSLFLRCGFSSLEVTHQPTIEALASGEIRGLAHVYQAPAPGSRWVRRSRSAVDAERRDDAA